MVVFMTESMDCCSPFINGCIKQCTISQSHSCIMVPYTLTHIPVSWLIVCSLSLHCLFYAWMWTWGSWLIPLIGWPMSPVDAQCVCDTRCHWYPVSSDWLTETWAGLSVPLSVSHTFHSRGHSQQIGSPSSTWLLSTVCKYIFLIPEYKLWMK